jgi:glycosyltransferase involved in cell wall biosynthesis
VLLARRFQIVHVQTPVAAFVMRLAVATLPPTSRPAVIYTAHGFHFHPQGGALRNAIALALERLAARWTDLLIVTNDLDLASARRHALLDSERIVQLPGVGVDADHFRADRVSLSDVASVYRELGISVGTPLIVCIAELNRNKNQSLLVRAVARMRHPGAQLVLRGDGPERARLEHLASDLGVAERVRFMGFQSDTRPLLRAASVFALVSHREGLPRSVMEALCLEVPVIGSDIRGIRDLIQDVGTLVAPNDVEGLAKSLDAVVANSDPATAHGAVGRRRMEAGYNLQLVLDLQLELYEDLRRGGLPGAPEANPVPRSGDS